MFAIGRTPGGKGCRGARGMFIPITGNELPTDSEERRRVNAGSERGGGSGQAIENPLACRSRREEHRKKRCQKTFRAVLSDQSDDCPSPAIIQACGPFTRCGAPGRGLGPRLPTGPVGGQVIAVPRAIGMERGGVRSTRSRALCKGASQRGKLNPSRRKRLLKTRPQSAQARCIRGFAARDRVDAAVALREMHEQFRAIVEADHDGHGAGRVLPEPQAFVEQELFDLLHSRIRFGGGNHSGDSRSRPVRAVGWSSRGPVLNFQSSRNGVVRHARTACGCALIRAAAMSGVCIGFHAEPSEQRLCQQG